MSLMSFMEAMGTSNIAIVAAFFIGLMTSISPCPLATNITAIAYISKKIEHSKHTLFVGLIYTFGRMVTYTALASLIVYIGLNTQQVSLFLQSYGEKLLGPFLVLIGLVMIGIIRFNFIKGSDKLNNIKYKLAEKGYIGSFLLGAIFALAFCPFSGVLFFGMLIPLALKANDGIFIPSIFGIATGLPVILFSILLVKSVSMLGKVMDKVQSFEKWMRKIVGIMFIIVGVYYVWVSLF